MSTWSKMLVLAVLFHPRRADPRSATGGLRITSRGGGNPIVDLAFAPRLRMSLSPRNSAVDAHDSIMVAILQDRPNTSLWRRIKPKWRVPFGSFGCEHPCSSTACTARGGEIVDVPAGESEPRLEGDRRSATLTTKVPYKSIVLCRSELRWSSDPSYERDIAQLQHSIGRGGHPRHDRKSELDKVAVERDGCSACPVGIAGQYRL